MNKWQWNRIIAVIKEKSNIDKWHWDRIIAVIGVIGTFAGVYLAYLTFIDPPGKPKKDDKEKSLTSESVEFFCGKGNDGIFTTYAKTANFNLAVIRWKYEGFAEYQPEKRCKEVSQRFNKYYQEGKLAYLTTGIENGLPIICVSSKFGGSCTGTLWTLKPGDNASKILHNLFTGYASSPILQSSGDTQYYVDINEFFHKEKIKLKSQ